MCTFAVSSQVSLSRRWDFTKPHLRMQTQCSRIARVEVLTLSVGQLQRSELRARHSKAPSSANEITCLSMGVTAPQVMSPRAVLSTTSRRAVRVSMRAFLKDW